MTDPDETPLLTQIDDLTDTPLSVLRTRRVDLAAEQETLIAQVERPRLNLGTGPPGRAD